MIRTLFVLLGCLILGLQYKAWFSDSGHFAIVELDAQVETRRAQTQELAQANRLLREEVLALKSGHVAIESRARQDLGMIRDDEVFFLVPEPAP